MTRLSLRKPTRSLATGASRGAFMAGKSRLLKIRTGERPHRRRSERRAPARSADPGASRLSCRRPGGSACTIVERAARLIGAPSGGLYLCDPDRQEARCMVSYNTWRDYTGTVLKYRSEEH